MIRNLKAMGLALVAVFAMSAMAASAAQAEKPADFWAETGTVKIDSTPDTVHQAFVTLLGTVTCTGVTGHAAYTEESKEQTATNVGYTNCHTTALGLSLPTTVTQDPGCHYTFTAGTYTSTGSGLSHGSVHICGSTIDIYTNHADDTANKLRCQIHVPAQTINGITYRNATGPNGKMAVTIEANGVNVSSTTTTNLGTVGCGIHKTETAVYTGSVWAEGTDINQNPTDTTVTGT